MKLKIVIVLLVGGIVFELCSPFFVKNTYMYASVYDGYSDQIPKNAKWTLFINGEKVHSSAIPKKGLFGAHFSGFKNVRFSAIISASGYTNDTIHSLAGEDNLFVVRLQPQTLTKR